MATKLGTVGILDILLAGDTANLKRATKEGATDLEKMGAVARSTATSVAKLSVAIGAAATAVFAFTNRVAEQGAEIARTSRRLGLTTAALSELRFAADQSGIKVQTLDMAMQRFGRRTAEAAQGTGEAKGALAELGIELVDGQGRLKSSDVLLGEVANAMQGVKAESDRVRLAMKLFDSEGVALLTMLEKGKRGLDEMRAAARSTGKVWEQEAAEAAEKFTQNVREAGAVIEGISMQLAGPLVQALNDAAEAFKRSRNSGMDFTDSLREMFSVAIRGTDIQRLERDLVNLTDAQGKAFRKLDEANRVSGQAGMKGFGERLRRQAQQELDGINRQIEDTRRMLEAMREIERQFGKRGREGGDGGAAGGMTEAEKKAEDERRKLLGEQLQWELDEEQRTREEIDAIYIAAHEKRIADEKQRQADLQAAKIAGYEWEQEQAIAQGEELLAIDKAIAEQKKAQRQREQQANAQFWDNLAGLMNTGSKKAFEIGKTFALGQAAVKGASAVMSAWEAGMSTGGPWAPLVAAAYAAAAGLNAINMMNNIRKQQFGGGGSAPVHPTQGASGVSPVGAGGGGQQQGRGESMTHIVKGLDPNQLISGRQLRELLNEGTRDGDRWVFA